MNKIHLIGNLTTDPTTSTTASGKTVCSFGIAVNKRKENEADFFRVHAWNGLGENCARFLAKGRKVAVTGSVSLSAYTSRNGEMKASMEVQADDVEFLTPKAENAPAAPQNAPKGFIEVTDDVLPWE